MPRFPTREADVASLANRIISGLREHAEDFPNPPHAADQLQASAATLSTRHTMQPFWLRAPLREPWR